MEREFEGKGYRLKVGSYVRKWRGIRGVKQHVLASQINLSGAALSYIENDITVPNLHQLEDIARSLDISIEMLLYGPKI